jgi:hypothetical protein
MSLTDSLMHPWLAEYRFCYTFDEDGIPHFTDEYVTRRTAIGVGEAAPNGVKDEFSMMSIVSEDVGRHHLENLNIQGSAMVQDGPDETTPTASQPRLPAGAATPPSQPGSQEQESSQSQGGSQGSAGPSRIQRRSDVFRKAEEGQAVIPEPSWEMINAASQSQQPLDASMLEADVQPASGNPTPLNSNGSAQASNKPASTANGNGKKRGRSDMSPLPESSIEISAGQSSSPSRNPSPKKKSRSSADDEDGPSRPGRATTKSGGRAKATVAPAPVEAETSNSGAVRRSTRNTTKAAR